MILHPALRIEPWAVHELALSLEHLAQMESIFALSNGHIGVRGNVRHGAGRRARRVRDVSRS